ncbi:hypothetical protein M3Y94_01281200 [Aphelenchoides besseyi]|nr:hypothetical protein M3Y94_01281200 [Aphelenchoides besseyi]KAI6222739.1 hypothetical protein M3Y95_00925600 [Aphelenchoides besseyi]
MGCTASKSRQQDKLVKHSTVTAVINTSDQTKKPISSSTTSGHVNPNATSSTQAQIKPVHQIRTIGHLNLPWARRNVRVRSSRLHSQRPLHRSAPPMHSSNEEESNEYENAAPYDDNLVHVQLINGKSIYRENGRLVIFDPVTKTTNIYTEDHSSAVPTIVGDNPKRRTVTSTYAI